MRAIRAMRDAREAVVTDLGTAAREDMLQKPLEKLNAGERDSPDLLAPVVTVPKRHVVIGHLVQSTVGDRDAEDVAPEIVEHPLPATRRLRVHDPRHRPDLGRYLVEYPRAAKSGAHLRAEEDRQRLHRDEDGGVLRGDPCGAAGREATRRHEPMDVGMVAHRARPCVEDGETPETRADVARIGGQRWRAAAALRLSTPETTLVREREPAQLARQGERHEIGRARQELRALRLEPPLGARAVTRRAVPVAAGVIAIDLPLAVITRRGVAAEVRSPARGEIVPHSPVTREQTVSHVGARRRAVEADDLRHREHVGLDGIRGGT